MTADRQEWMVRDERGNSALPAAVFVEWRLSQAAAGGASSGSRSSGSRCRLCWCRIGPSSLWRCLFGLLPCPDCWSSTRWAFGPAALSARLLTRTAIGEPAYGRTDCRTSSPWSGEVPLPCADSPLCGSASRKERGEGERERGGGWQGLRRRRERESLRERESARGWNTSPRGDTCKLHGGHSMFLSVSINVLSEKLCLNCFVS